LRQGILRATPHSGAQLRAVPQDRATGSAVARASCPCFPPSGRRSRASAVQRAYPALTTEGAERYPCGFVSLWLGSLPGTSSNHKDTKTLTGPRGSRPRRRRWVDGAKDLKRRPHGNKAAPGWQSTPLAKTRRREGLLAVRHRRYLASWRPGEKRPLMPFNNTSPNL